MCALQESADLYERTLQMLGVAGGGWAFADTFNAVTGARMGGEGRSQVGGVFGPLALRKMNLGWRAISAAD